MPKQIVRDVFGELLETGKATARAGRTVLNKSKTPSLEKGQTGKTKAIKNQKTEDQIREEQVKRLAQVDKKRSQEAYKQISDQIQLYRRKKASLPRKYVTAKTGYDELQHKEPETFFSKLKKKKEAMKDKFLPWSKKKGQGTGEIRRGVSG